MSKKVLALLFALIFLLSACAVADDTSSADVSGDASSETVESSADISSTSSADSTSSEESSEVSSEVSNEVSSEVSNEVSSDASSEASSEESNEISSEASSEESSDETTVDDGIKKEQVVDGLLIDVNDRIMEIFSYSDKNKGGKTYAAIMNDFYAELQKQDANIKLYSMVIPKACAYYLAETKTYSHKADCTLIALQHIADNLDSGIINVDVYNALLPHKDENIYFRTDYHWAPLGAYYAAEALADSAGVTFDDISCYDSKTREGFLGALYPLVKLSRIKNNPDTFTVYKNTKYTYGTDYTVTYHDYGNFKKSYEHDIFYDISDDNYTAWYLTYLAGDSKAVHIKSNTCKNGRRLVILKESYGNPLPAYLLGSFEETWILDIRYFKDNILDFVAEYGITDVSVSLSMPSVVGSKQNYIKTLMKQGR